MQVNDMQISGNHKDLEAAYRDTLKWIHSTMRLGSRLGLERVSRLLELMGNPHQRTKFIHVTGTNGKGSVTAMAASILKEAGYKTGMFTSPYLEEYRERIMLNGKKIPKHALVEITALVREKVERLLEEGFDHPTEFEVNTAIAFEYFARERCDYVVLEVGLGGRFDATNVVTPVVSVITTIDFDHMDRLGDTLPQIAFEKAGIIKPGVPVVTGVTEEETLEVIKKRAIECNSELYIVDQAPFADIRWADARTAKNARFSPATKKCSDHTLSQLVDISGPGFACENVTLSLLGRHQQLNAALAVAALKVAKVPPLASTALTSPVAAPASPDSPAPSALQALSAPPAQPAQAAYQDSQDSGASPVPLKQQCKQDRGIHLDEQAVRTGLANTVWPGRLEVIHKEPLIILDGAHNPQGARVLAEFIKGKLAGRKIICVFGILSDKCYREPTSYIAPLCHQMIITRPHSPRALDPEKLAREARRYTPNVTIEEDSDKAMELAITKASSDDVVLCCGSLYLVGPARTYIRKRFGISPYGGE